MPVYAQQAAKPQDNYLKLLPYFNSNIKLLGLPQKIFNSPHEIDIRRLSGIENGRIFDKAASYTANLWFFDPAEIENNGVEDGDITEEKLKNTKAKLKAHNVVALCFVPFLRESNTFITQGFRYVAFKFQINFSKSYPALSKLEIIRWITLCQEHKLLPQNIDAEQIWRTSNIVLKYADLKPNQLYVYLSSIRYIQEAPHFIRSVLYLNDTLGVDFYISLVVASKYICPAINTGHHILPVSALRNSSIPKGQYPETNLMAEIDLRFANAFRTFVEKYMTTNGKTIEEAVMCNARISFTVHTQLFSIIHEKSERLAVLTNTKLKNIRLDYIKAAVYLN